MNQRDQFNRGRGERYPRSDEQQDRERMRSSLRDTYNPEPQWLRDDRERREQAYEDQSEYGHGERMSSDRDEQEGRGSYAGAGREWGDPWRSDQWRDQERESQRRQWERQGSQQYGGGQSRFQQGGGQSGGPRYGSGQYSQYGGGAQYGSQAGSGSRGGYDNAYGGSGRDAERYGAGDRGWSERYRGFPQQGYGRSMEEERQYGLGAHRQRDDSVGESSRWDEQDYSGRNRDLAPFRVGTGMGVGTRGYGREGFGTSYGTSSGYGEPGGGYGYGTTGSDDESARHWSAERHREGSQYGSRGGWDLGLHQRDRGERDWRGEGEREHGPRAWLRSFRGLGPQSYKRPDDRIRDDIYERLTDDHHIDARNIMVDVNQGNVTLTGTVNERRMRYMAEDLVENVMGVANINNQLKVQRESSQSNLQSQQGAGSSLGGGGVGGGVAGTGSSLSGTAGTPGTAGGTGATAATSGTATSATGGTPGSPATGENKSETKRH